MSGITEEAIDKREHGQNHTALIETGMARMATPRVLWHLPDGRWASNDFQDSCYTSNGKRKQW